MSGCEVGKCEVRAGKGVAVEDGGQLTRACHDNEEGESVGGGGDSASGLDTCLIRLTIIYSGEGLHAKSNSCKEEFAST